MPEPWVCQNTPAPAVALGARLQHRADGVVDAQVLVVLRQHLDHAGLVLGEQREVLGDVEQAARLAQPTQHHVQRHPAWLVLALDALPLEVALPVGRQRSHPAVGAVAGDQQQVGPEQARHAVQRVLVAGEVGLKSLLGRHARFFQLHHHPGQDVDKAHQIGPAGVERTLDRELADQQKVVVGRDVPVHHPHPLDALPAVGVGHSHRHAVAQLLPQVTVGGHRGHATAVACHLVGRSVQRRWRQAGVQPVQHRTQPRRQHRLGLGLAAQRGIAALGRARIQHGPAQLRHQRDGRLLDLMVLGEAGLGRRAHESVTDTVDQPASRAVAAAQSSSASAAVAASAKLTAGTAAPR